MLFAEWLHGSEVLVADPSPKVAANASLIESSNFVGLQMQLQVPQPFVEIADHAQDVIGIYAIKSVSKSPMICRIFFEKETLFRLLLSSIKLGRMLPSVHLG